ncbi:TonB-dependent receptor plug domain-containing protein [Methylibium sp.]|uniref:TonB-dependent receptor plug domain-containing protein n=1 Tax=Methylibium sp. TaxID=2067992 RepID=UPI003D0B5B61
MTRRTRPSASLAALVASVLLSLGAGVQAQDVQKLERVEVTGSAIKRTEVEGPVPVQVVTRKDIDRTGASTINELMKSIMSLDIFDDGELSTGSPVGTGTATVFMRGLDESNVLVLLNGRRLPVRALYDSSGAGAAVDVNTIPLSAIERIEILKDGGSAIYGADAVAGVVNFITRKSYTGFELRAGYGISSRGDGEERKAGLSAGFGTLEADGYNVFAGVDLFKRDPILRSDRDMSSSADFRRFGGPDARSVASPYGNYVDPNSFLLLPNGGQVRPCPSELLDADGICRYDFNASLLTAYNGADRLSGLLLGTVQLAPGLQGFAELLASHSRDQFVGHPTPAFFADANGLPYLGRFMQGGPRIARRTSDLLHLSAGLEGTIGEVEWKVDAGRGRSRVVNDDRNAFTYTGIEQIDATSLSNDPALVESLRVSPRRQGESTLTFANGRLNGELMQMPAGPLAYAVGSSVWKESLVDTPDPLSQADEIAGGIQQSAVDARRRAYAFFTELNVPVTPKLEGQVALRYDHYPNASKTSPKIAARYLFSPAFSTRASYSQSFRMPSLKQLYGTRESGASDFTNDTLCAAFGQAAGCTLSNGLTVNGANPDLKPEKGRTYNLGFVLSPGGGFNGTLDIWQIRITDQISIPTIDQAIAAGKFAQDSQGRVVVNTDLQNFAQARVQGLDLQLEQRIGTAAAGSFTLRNDTTYYLKQERQAAPGEPWQDFNGVYLYPKWRNVFSVSWERAAWAHTLALRSTSGFDDTDEPDAPAGTRKVASHHEVDAVSSFSGLKNLRIDFGIRNLFDRMPPFSVTNASDGRYTQLGFAELYTNRGRFFFLNASYQFK